MDGWQVCKEIRKTSNRPIIMLTAKGELFDKILGLELGADDYIIKPFEAKEVIARIHAVLRRTSTSEEKEKVKEINWDKLSINLIFYKLLRQYGSYRKCSTEYFSHKRSCNNQLKRKCHNEVLRNISQPDNQQCTPLS